MAYLIVVNLLALLALQCLSITEATHFRNGIITFAPVDSNSNTMILTFRLAFRRTFSYSYNCDESIIRSGILRGSGGSWRATCSKVSCGWWTIASTGFKCTDYSVDEDWTMGENNFTYTFPSVAQEWVVSYQGCCWISSLVKYPDGNWLVSTTVNLTRRSDTGKINSSPVSKSPAIVRFKEGCPQSFRIPVEDPDNDIVKCRWATYSESSRYIDSFPHSTLDERTCELWYNGNNGTVGTYAVAITIEDFPAGTTDFDSVTPFSSVGLQFLVKITEQNGSCVDVPIFTESTPSDGECTEVQIGSAYRAVIEVKLQYSSRHVKEIVTSSPVGMQLMPLQYNASQGIYYRNITWYPSQYQVGQQLFCFKAVDSEGSESEWRCITILVGLSNTPRVVFGTQWPMHPKSEIGPGLTSLGIQFDRSIKKPRVSSYITLVLLPSENTVYKVDTLSHHVRISSNRTGLFFAFPKAALSMTGSYAILMDRGAVVGLGCSFDGPPTPGILSVHDWAFNVNGVCPSGYYLEPPDYTNCVDVNECGGQSRKRRFAWWPQGMASTLTSIPAQSSSISVPANSSMTTSTTQMPSTSNLPATTSPLWLSGPCMYNLTDLQGNFTSPNYPFSYPNNLDCLWTITVTPGYYIHLNFSNFSLEGTYGLSFCPYDYVEVSDLNYPSSSIKIQRCGYQSPWCVLSTSNVLHVRFVSDVIIPSSGFKAQYESSKNYVDENCLSLNITNTTNLQPTKAANYSMTTSTTQMPSTPNLPATTSPPSLSECLNHSYLEESVRGQGFYNGYHGYYQCDNGLSFGWYRFRGAAGTQMPTACVGKNRCSSHAPGWLNSSHPSVEDGIVVAKVCFHWSSGCCTWSTFIRVRNCSGFYVYELGPPPTCWLRYCGNGGSNYSMTTSAPQSSPAPGSCANYLTDLQGNFSSPNYPSSYPHHLNCTWSITVTPGSYIYLQFSYFSLEYGGSYCPFDYVEVSDSNYPSSSIQIKRCGYQSPWCVWSTSNVLHVRFVTDYSVSASGFLAHYATYGNPGSGNCLSLNATQTNYSMTTSAPQSSPAPANSSMTTSTTQMPSTSNLPATTSPPWHSAPNYWMTTSTTQMPSTPNLPATTSPPSLSECLNHSYLEDSVRGQGFYNGYHGYYQCDNGLSFGWYRFRGAAGTQMPTACVGKNRCSSHAPGWLNSSHPSVEDGIVVAKVCFHWSSGCCTWSTFIRVRNCSGFYVYELGPPPACWLRYCGNGGSNYSMTTSAPQSSPAPGSCANNLTDLQGNFSSPNYPSSYPHHLDCLWSITVTPGSFIYLQFSDFSVEYGSSYCPYDYVEVSDSNYPSSSIQIKRCGYNQSPWCVWSTSNVLHVRFVTDLSVSASGFMAHYATYGYPGSGNCLSLNATQTNYLMTTNTTQMPSTPTSYLMTTNTTQMPSTPNIPATTSPPSFSGPCMYNLTDLQGNFTSPNYPFSYPNNLDCLWTITVTPGHYIILHFSDFSLEGTYGRSFCPYDYVEVSDLNYTSSSISIQRCGYQSPWCVLSTSNVLHVRFVADFIISYTGFTAQYISSRNYGDENCLSLNVSNTTNLPPTKANYFTSSIPQTSPSPAIGIHPTPASKTPWSLLYHSSSVVPVGDPDFHLHLPSHCEQTCHNTPGSYSCSCVSGYQLNADGKTCSDINECSVNNGGCSHHCYNIAGAYYCGCPDGTTMAANNLTCVEPGFSVTCGEYNMTVFLEKQSFPFFQVQELHLRYPSCRATENSTHLIINTRLNDCGTSVNDTQDALLFWNELRVDAVIVDQVITRSHDIRLPFYCSYSRRDLISLSFTPQGIYIGEEVGYGNFTFKMDFFPSGSFVTPYTSNDYPIEMRMNDYIYVRYSVESGADLVIMAENCRATKDGSFYSWPQYTIIQNGCPKDSTMDYSYDPNRPYQEFSMRSFRFFNDYKAIYFHCQLLACHRSSPNTRCQSGCLRDNKRKRRAVTRDAEHEESTTKNIVSRGPLFFRQEVNQGDTGANKEEDTLIGGIAGASGICLIAVIALGVMFVKYRIARRLMNRNKVGDLYTTQEEEMRRKNAYIKDDDETKKDDSL